MIAYPEDLPEPQRDGYGFQAVSPLARSEFQSGRTRQRRRFTSVPTVATVTWLFTEVGRGCVWRLEQPQLQRLP